MGAYRKMERRKFQVEVEEKVERGK